MANANPFSSKAETDWEKCCLCQTAKKKESLKTPKPGSQENDGYAMIATNIVQFKAINQLPFHIVIERLDEGDGIEATLRIKQAKYHQSCRLLLNNTKLERAKKRAADTETESEVVLSKVRRQSLELEKCFLCDCELTKGEPRQAMTMGIDQRLNECARNLNDGKLLAILSGGDAVALELKYHKSCLTTLYNKERAHLSSIEAQESSDPREKQVFPLVFSELVAFIMEAKVSATGPLVFHLNALVTMFKQRLEQFGIETQSRSDVHSTRLKVRLLAEIPDLEAHSSGNSVTLAFKKDIGPVLSQSSSYSEAVVLSKAATILRKSMLHHKCSFDGRFNDACVEDSIPPTLMHFVYMLEHGVDVKSRSQPGACKTDSAMAQLLQYNCHAKHKEGASTFRHSKERETPFPIFIGTSVYAKTRKRALVELLHENGLSVPYNRVLEISAQLGDAAIGRYANEGVVCPSALRKGIFTTAAMDNIDHNPTATTASTSFHGTSISLFQYPTADNEGEKREPLTIRDNKVMRVPELPDSFTNVTPAVIKGKVEPPKIYVPINLDSERAQLQLNKEFEWLESVRLTQMLSEDMNLTWSAYHTAKKRGLAFEVSITSLLPLLRDAAHSVATVRHVMDTVRDTVAYLNPAQTPVLTADQPIYAVAKQIQWNWPNVYGEDKFVIMFGGLHIEMAALKSIGSFLQSSGWTGAVAEAEVASSGTAESFLTASSVTKTRKAHQVTACALYKLLKDSYDSYCIGCEGENQPTLDFEPWCDKRIKESPQFNYWFIVLSMELTILSVIRSFREANFKLYCQALAALIPFFFSNNNVNYARWLPVHLKDMLTLDVTHPNVYQAFQDGKFVVFKSKRLFSAMAIDQAHEQANATIKGEGGAVGVTEDPSALRRWMVAGPEVSRLASEYEAIFEAKDVNENVRHSGQTPKAQRTFFEQVDRMYTVVQEMGNPFQEESTDLLSLDTKVVALANSTENLATHLQTGRERFKKFMNSFETPEAGSFYEPIKKSKLDFFNQKSQETKGELKQKVLKEDYRLFSKLFISCQSRECDLLEFFKHENQPFPAALSDNGSLHSCQKSQLTSILETKAESSETVPDASVIIVDGSALVNAMKPRQSKTFEEYATLDVVPKVKQLGTVYRRTDIVFDVYKADSLKCETRSKRGQGSRRRVTNKGTLPANWRNFLRDDDNKTDLFNFLADKIAEQCLQNIVIVTKGENVVSNQDATYEELASCNHEEADTRMFVHLKHSVDQGHANAMLKASDTDVLVLAVSKFPTLRDKGLEKLWIEFGQGQTLRWIPIHDIASSVREKVPGIGFFHAFTGCDTVSAFRGKAKKAAWHTWDVVPEATEVFRKLSCNPPTIENEDKEVLEKFVITMYDRSSSSDDIHEVRLDMFARKQRQYDAIPPTRAALLEHIKRAAYQAGCIWGQCLEPLMETANPADWGWAKQSNMWRVHWTSMAPIAESCKQLTKCGCKKECIARRKCYKNGLPCTELCSCRCEI